MTRLVELEVLVPMQIEKGKRGQGDMGTMGIYFIIHQVMSAGTSFIEGKALNRYFYGKYRIERERERVVNFVFGETIWRVWVWIQIGLCLSLIGTIFWLDDRSDLSWLGAQSC